MFSTHFYLYLMFFLPVPGASAVLNVSVGTVEVAGFENMYGFWISTKLVVCLFLY